MHNSIIDSYFAADYDNIKAKRAKKSVNIKCLTDEPFSKYMAITWKKVHILLKHLRLIILPTDKPPNSLPLHAFCFERIWEVM